MRPSTWSVSRRGLLTGAAAAGAGALTGGSTETATEWSGYMDGAVRSGMRAADEIPGASSSGN